MGTSIHVVSSVVYEYVKILEFLLFFKFLGDTLPAQEFTSFYYNYTAIFTVKIITRTQKIRFNIILIHNWNSLSADSVASMLTNELNTVNIKLSPERDIHSNLGRLISNTSV